MNFVSWAGILCNYNAQRLASANLELYVPKPESFNSNLSSKFRQKSLYMNKKAMEYGSDFIVVDDPNHPLISILTSPNQIDTGWTFLYKIYMSIQASGVAYLYKIRQGNRVVGLQVLRSPWMLPQPLMNGFGIDYYQYSGPQSQRIDAKDVIVVKIPTIGDELGSMGWCYRVWNDLQLSDEKQLSDLHKWKNRGRPDLIYLWHGMSGESVKEAGLAVEEKMNGTSNNGKGIHLSAEQVDVQDFTDKNIEPGDNDTLIRKLCFAAGVPFNKISASAGLGGGTAQIAVDNDWLESQIGRASCRERV